MRDASAELRVVQLRRRLVVLALDAQLPRINGVDALSLLDFLHLAAWRGLRRVLDLQRFLLVSLCVKELCRLRGGDVGLHIGVDLVLRFPA